VSKLLVNLLVKRNLGPKDYPMHLPVVTLYQASDQFKQANQASFMLSNALTFARTVTTIS